MILSINQSPFERPKIKRNEEKLKKLGNQARLHHSKTYSSIGSKTDRKCISKVTFDFNSINNSLNNSKDIQRIHGKQSRKGFGEKEIFEKSEQRQFKKHKKQRSYLNVRISELTNAQSKEELEKSCQNVLLNVKSYRSSLQSEDEKQKSSDNFKKHQRYSSNIVEMITINESKNIFNESLQQKIKEKYHQYAISRQNKKINISRKGINTRNFYLNTSNVQKNEKLKQKAEINAQQDQILLEGSQKSKHKRPTTSRRPKEQRKSEFLTPNNSILLQKSSSQKKDLAKQQNKSFLNYREMKKFKDDSLKILTSSNKTQKQQRHTSKQKFSQKSYVANALITYDNASPPLMKLKDHIKQHSKKAAKKNYAKQNENLHLILSQCAKYKNDRILIDPQVTALQYCCEKIASNIQNFGLNDTHQF